MRYRTLNYKLFVILAFFGLWACNNQPTQIQTSPRPPSSSPTQPKTAITGQNGFFYGNSFRVQNSSAYEKLMESCRRCGTRRLISNPGGGTTYQRFYVGHSDPKRCRNWNTDGYIQIHFKERKLPTVAVVSIQPKYANSNRWGEPFSITAQANPINENNGFEILLNPTDGLGGVNTLIVRSMYSNHVLKDSLSLTVIYGQDDSQTVISETIPRLTKRAIKKSFYTCNTYTN